MDLNCISIEEFVQYINEELNKDKNISVNKLCDRIGIKKSTLKSRMTRANYSYNSELRKYIKDRVIYDNTEVLQEAAITKEGNGNSVILLNNLEVEKLNLLLDNLDNLLKLSKLKNGMCNIESLSNESNRGMELKIDSVLFQKAKQKAKEDNMSIDEFFTRALKCYINK